MALTGDLVEGQISIPLATYETPLWDSTARGAGVSRYSGGIRCTLVDERMSRSILLRAENAAQAHQAWQMLHSRQDEIAALIATTGRFVRLLEMNRQAVGDESPDRWQSALSAA